MSCKACGSEFEVREVQMRSADEPQTEVKSCPKCAVNPDKINPLRSPPRPRIPLSKHIRRSAPITPRRGTTSGLCHLVVFDVTKNHPFNGTELPQKHLTRNVLLHLRRSSDYSEQVSVGATEHVSGLFKEYCTKLFGLTTLCAGCVQETYEITTSPRQPSRECIIKGIYAEDKPIGKYNTYIYSEYASTERKYIVEIRTGVVTNTVLKNIVDEVYNRGLGVTDLSRYIGSDRIARLANLSARGWDASSPPQEKHVFTCKVDGERNWATWIGYMWYYTSPKYEQRKGKTPLLQWSWSGSANNNDPVVLDVEDMLSYGYVLIDCLTDNVGGVAPIIRDMSWCLKTFSEILSVSGQCRVGVRSYTRDFTEASLRSKRVMYPTDGVVAIRDSSTEILKIKDTKSMELRLDEDGRLLTSDNIEVTRLSQETHRRYKVGSLLEIRFTMSDKGVVHVKDIFHRSDKALANSSSAVADIIQSATKMVTKDDNDRRIALLWCNTLRRLIYTKASSVKSSNSIILDVGTGASQSLDSIESDPATSYILLEPDVNRCKLIARRLRINKILGVDELRPKVKSLKNRATEKVIVNCTLSELLEHDAKFTDMLMREIKCVTCVFSMHFVVKELHFIHAAYDVPIIGCGYTYDRLSEDNILIDAAGVSMRAVSGDVAEVKWGGDTVYSEPITTTRDYAGLPGVSLASDSTPLPNSSLSAAANAICSHITSVGLL